MTASLPDITALQKQGDELQFVDEDIRAAFADRRYLLGTPTMVQLVRELQLLRRALQSKADNRSP